jgi:hypothetical protein
MKPNIINEKSKFVVITYFWGRGNLNKNTQRPCPEDLEEDSEIEVKPIKYEKVLEKLEKSCIKNNCNYLIVEYPEFAVKGNYQQAINYKPKFIKEALKACYPRSVVYVDGDMTINKYPLIFDIDNVDFMSRGWNTDDRSEFDSSGETTCFYPFVYELSGGTIYFANTIQAYNLLDEWYKKVLKDPTKAEDRVLSYIITVKKLMLPINTIQLPIEYLWLSMYYDDYLKRKSIYIEHPECLTGEERAKEDSNIKTSDSRQPNNYDRLLTDNVYCNLRNIPFYEYIYFPSKEYISGFKVYLKHLSKSNIIDIIKYDDKYGKYNKIANQNKKLSTSFSVVKNIDILYSPYNNNSIPMILAYLLNGVDVMIYPKDKVSSRRKSSKRKSRKRRSDMSSTKNDIKVPYTKLDHEKFKKDLDLYEFICKNINTSKQFFKKEYKLKIDKKYPIMFSHKSNILIHLLMMCEKLDDISKIFNSTYIFMSRIRCKF